MRVLDLVIAAVGVALVGVALWVFVLGGPSGESQPPASQAGLTPASAQEPTAMPTNRRDCDAIRGTDYLSPEERTWFFDNCTAPLADEPSVPPPAVPPVDEASARARAASAADQPPAPPPAAPSADQPPPPAESPADQPPPPPTDEPPAPAPPSDDDLYYEFTRFDFTSSAFFYVYFENQDPNWAVCDLMFYVDYHYERLDGSILLGRTEPTTVSYLGPLEGIEGHTLGGGGAYPFRLLDYTLFLDWAWC